MSGTVKSAIGLGNLLWMGIGDTLRVSALGRSGRRGQGGLRDPEIARAAPSRREHHLLPLLRAAGLRRDQDREALEKRLAHVKTPMTLSIIGCVVNGPGEALMTDIGFTGGGAGSGMVYLAGKQSHKLSNAQMIDHIVEQVEQKAAEIEARTGAEAAE